MNKEELENHLQAIEAAISELLTLMAKEMYYRQKIYSTMENISKWIKRIAGKR